MLEFIVLGQIPGTGIVLTFSWVVTIASITLLGALLKHDYAQRHISQQVSIEELAI